MQFYLQGCVNKASEPPVANAGSDQSVSTGSIVRLNGSKNSALIFDVKQISAGGQYTVAVKNDDTLWTWGSSDPDEEPLF